VVKRDRSTTARAPTTTDRRQLATATVSGNRYWPLATGCRLNVVTESNPTTAALHQGWPTASTAVARPRRPTTFAGLPVSDVLAVIPPNPEVTGPFDLTDAMGGAGPVAAQAKPVGPTEVVHQAATDHRDPVASPVHRGGAVPRHAVPHRRGW
jgi:hypothetical protein